VTSTSSGRAVDLGSGGVCEDGEFSLFEGATRWGIRVDWGGQRKVAYLLPDVMSAFAMLAGSKPNGPALLL